MKKTKLSALLLALTACSLSLPVSALQVGQGLVTFSGQVVTDTCNIVNDNLVVPLPTVSTHTMATAGIETGIRNFNIDVVDCPDSFKKVQAHFEPLASIGTGQINYKTWNLVNDYVDTTGTNSAASNVEVRLYNADHSQIRPGDTGSEVDVVNGTARMTYAGGYYTTGAAGAGMVSAHIVYTLAYP